MMAARKKASPLPPDTGLVSFTFRMPTELIPELDAWVTDLNAGRSWPKLTRSDVLRMLIAFGTKNRPDLEKK